MPHGFRRRLSTVTLLVSTRHSFTLAINNQMWLNVIFLNFAETFDNVPRSKLFLGLEAIGVRELWLNLYGSSSLNEHSTLKLIKTFLVLLTFHPVFRRISVRHYFVPNLFQLLASDSEVCGDAGASEGQIKWNIPFEDVFAWFSRYKTFQIGLKACL